MTCLSSLCARFAAQVTPRGYPGRARCVRICVWVGLVVAFASGRSAHAFHPDVHRILTVRSLRGQIQHGTVLPPDMTALIDFYGWLGWSMAHRGSDEAGKLRFLREFPERKNFDAIGVRRLLSLSLDPDIDVWGVTEITKEPEPDRFSVAADASARPALDHRARNRVYFTAQHVASKDTFGAPIPLDPRALALGPATGLGSATWARTALPRGATSTDAAAESGLRVVPFLPGLAVRGGAAEMAQLHMDLSVLAMNWGDSQYKQTAEYLSLVWLGAALHYVQEAASPLHNVQLGSPALLDAMAARYRRQALKTGGGRWGPLPNPVIAALRMRRNLRVVGDRWLADQVTAALDEASGAKRVAAAVVALRTGDPAFDAAVRPGLAPWLQPPRKAEPSAKGRGAVSVLVDALAAAGAADGAALYDALAVVTLPRWRDGAADLPEAAPSSAVPWRTDESAATKAAWAQIEEIQARALRRAATATMLAFDAWLNANPHAALDRLRRVRTLAVEREAKATAAWARHTQNPAFVRDPRWAYAEIGGGLVLLLLLLAIAVLWRRRRS